MRFDVSDVDTGKLDGAAYAEPGTYHFTVTDVVEENDKGHFEAHLSILGGTPKGMEGRTHRETFFLTPRAISRVVQLATALKLTTTEEVERCKANGDELDVDWSKAAGRQFCGRLSHKTNQDGTKSQYCELGFQIWALDSKAAKGVPLDATAAKAFLASVGVKTQQTGQHAATKPAAGKAAPAASPAAADPFGGTGVDELFG